jgi:hypothetical protein
MSNDYLKNNSNRCGNKNISKNRLKCSCQKFQSYDRLTFGEVINTCSPISCNVTATCNKQQYNFQKYVLNQQNLYALMRRHPEKFPLIPWVSEMNLTPAQQRSYSNLWYRQFGTSQALPVNDNWGGFFLPGTETPWTN